jgi:RecA-family ATPase
MTKHVPPPTTINWKVASDFLEVIYGCSPKVTFQVFDDKGGRQELASWRHGTPAQCRQWITKKAAQGCGVFFTLNECDGAGRRAHNVLRTFTQASDFDTTALPTVWALEPDVIVQSSPGKFHTYWLCEPTDDLDKWCDTQARLAAYYHSDPRIIDRPRVLRLPGTWHQKKTPFQTRVELMPAPADVRTGDFARHDHISLANSHPCAYRAPGSYVAPSKDHQALCELDTEDAIARGDEYLLDAPLSVDGEGGNDTAYRVACQLSDIGLSVDVMLDRMMVDGGWNDQCDSPWTEKELRTICRNAVSYKRNPPGAKTAEAEFSIAPNLDTDQQDRDLTAAELASEEASDYTADTVQHRDTPAQTWIVQDMIVDDDVIGFYGDGGSGKTYTALQLLMASTAGVPWLGKPTSGPMRTMFISCEERTSKINPRIKAIVESIMSPYLEGKPDAIAWSALAGMKVKVLADRDAILATLDLKGRKIVTTKLYKTVKEWIGEWQPKLVVFDALFDIYGEDQNNLPLVRQFVKKMRKLTREFDCAIIITAHPSLMGMTTGTGTSGSVGWRNSYRGFLYMTIDKPANADAITVHRIESRKQNYGKPDVAIDTYWNGGLFTPVYTSDEEKANRRDAAKKKFLGLVQAYNSEGRAVGFSTGSSYAPSVFAKNKEQSGGFKKDEFKDAMESLFADKRIAVRPYRMANRHTGKRIEVI